MVAPEKQLTLAQQEQLKNAKSPSDILKILRSAPEVTNVALQLVVENILKKSAKKHSKK